MTSAKAGWLANHGQVLQIKKKESVVVRALDSQKQVGKGLYGAGLLLGKSAIAAKIAAEDRANKKVEISAHERAQKIIDDATNDATDASTIYWNLSEREQKIIDGLG